MWRQLWKNSGGSEGTWHEGNQIPKVLLDAGLFAFTLSLMYVREHD